MRNGYVDVFIRVIVVHEEHARAQDRIPPNMDMILRRYDRAFANLAAILNDDYGFIIFRKIWNVQPHFAIEPYGISYFDAGRHGPANVTGVMGRQAPSQRSEGISPRDPAAV